MIRKLLQIVMFTALVMPAYAGVGTILETETGIIVEYSGDEEDHKAAAVREKEVEKELNAAKAKEAELEKERGVVKKREEKTLDKQLNPSEKALQRQKTRAQETDD